MSFNVILKWALSFLKEDWAITDYPVRIREQQGLESPRTGLQVPRYVAQIENWWQVSGVGETRAQALSDLANSLAAVKERHRQLPRPGTGLPIEFAPMDEIERYWGVVSRIVSEVLEYDPEDIFITDGSSLWDFAFTEDAMEGFHSKIRKVFGVDVSHIESGNIVEVAQYIFEQQVSD